VERRFSCGGMTIAVGRDQPAARRAERIGCWSAKRGFGCGGVKAIRVIAPPPAGGLARRRVSVIGWIEGAALVRRGRPAHARVGEGEGAGALGG